MKKLLAGILIGCVLTIGGITVSGCEDAKRFGKSVTSDFVGLKRKVVWTGFDGSKRTWEGKFKIDASSTGTHYFIKDGKTVILGSGWYSEEIN